MKKTIAVLLIFVLALGLYGCTAADVRSDDQAILLFESELSEDEKYVDGESSDDKDEDVAEDEEDEDVAEDEEDEDIAEDEENEDDGKKDREDEEDEERPEKEETVKDEDDEDSSDLIPGETDGDVFKSDYSGLEFTKPSGWSFYSTDQLYELMDIGADALDIEISEYQKEVAKLTMVYDMMAVSLSGDNVQIIYENLVPTRSTKITEEQYLDNVAMGLENMGYTVGDSGETKLSGITYCYIEASNVVSGKEINQVYYARKTGNYMSGVISTLVTKDREDIEQMFS